ncbi:hypothetical protein FRC10_005622 [Ceratobasidium sp. 414]|nr:hypothetical protein FRC10_005622 [Ceratobasidium sp. 414]
MQALNYQRPCSDMCWAVVRMTALGYHPSTIEACMGIPGSMVHDILKSFFASGYSLPAVSPTIAQSLYPPPAYPRDPSGSTRGVPAVQVVAAPPPAQAQLGQGARVETANTGSYIIYQSSPSRQPLASPRQVSVVQSLPPAPAEARPPPPVKWSPVKFPRPVIPVPLSVSAPQALRVPSVEQVAKANLLATESAHLPDPVKDQKYSDDISVNDIQDLWIYLHTNPDATLSDLRAVLLQRRVVVSPFKLVRALRNHRIRFSNVDPEPNKQARDEYALRVGELELEQLVFIGQISCDVRFMVGFALSCEGFMALQISAGDAGEQTYASFIGYALGWMQAFPMPESVAVLSRQGVSKGDKVLGDIKTCGMKHLFLPPGSSDYNPTKQAISLIKSRVDCSKESLGEAETKEDVEAILHHNVFKIEKEQAHEWFRECGYA